MKSIELINKESKSIGFFIADKLEEQDIMNE